jgi:hypothetical protein
MMGLGKFQLARARPSKQVDFSDFPCLCETKPLLDLAHFEDALALWPHQSGVWVQRLAFPPLLLRTEKENCEMEVRRKRGRVSG